MSGYKLINEHKARSEADLKATSMNREVCAGAFLEKKNKFLFGKRAKNKDWAPGKWDIVGGRSLKNEHPMFTMQREDCTSQSTLMIREKSTVHYGVL